MKTKSLYLVLTFALISVVNSGFAQTWQHVPPFQGFGGFLETDYYGAIGMSADGRIICAVPEVNYPVISTNFGTTWVRSTNTGNWASALPGWVAVSADGSRIYAAMGNSVAPYTRILVATNQGSVWAYFAFPQPNPTYLKYVACSADGMKAIAASSGQSPILYSKNGGVSYSTSSVAPAAWTSLASSAEGDRMVAAASGGSIYFSEDFGVTWTPTNLPAEAWSSVCTSANGKWIGATSDTHSYISSDSGVTWLTNDFAGIGIACSANGAVWLITSTNVETSTNGGQSWQTNLAPDQWSGGAVSADGNLMAVMGKVQGVWIGRFTPSPQLNIQSQDPDVAISWLIPSTNFVLQQSAELSNPTWTIVSNAPTLNFTNLNQQVSVPETRSNAFFRLIAQ